MWSAAAAWAKPEVQLRWEVVLPERAEPTPFGWSDEPHVTRWSESGRLDRRDAVGTGVDDGWFTTACDLSGRALHLTLSYVPSHYPEHLPEDMECTVGRYRLVIAFRAAPPLYAEPSELWVREGDPFPLRLWTGGEARRTLVLGLDPSVPWAAAATFLRAEGARWGGGSCAVTPGDRPTVTVSYDGSMTGEGACEVLDAAGGAHALRFVREDVPVAR